MDLANLTVVILYAFVMKLELLSYLLFVFIILAVVFLKVVIHPLKLIFHPFLDVFLPRI